MNTEKFFPAQVRNGMSSLLIDGFEKKAMVMRKYTEEFYLLCLDVAKKFQTMTFTVRSVGWTSWCIVEQYNQISNSKAFLKPSVPGIYIDSQLGIIQPWNETRKIFQPLKRSILTPVTTPSTSLHTPSSSPFNSPITAYWPPQTSSHNSLPSNWNREA